MRGCGARGDRVAACTGMMGMPGWGTVALGRGRAFLVEGERERNGEGGGGVRTIAMSVLSSAPGYPDVVGGRLSNPLAVRQAHHERIEIDFAVVLRGCGESLPRGETVC